MYDQKQVIIIDGKKYAQWESKTNDYDVKTIECRPVTFECPMCGCVTSDDDPFKRHFKGQPAEFVRMSDGTHLCSDCANGDSDTQVCEDCRERWHIKGDGFGYKNEYGEWFCDDCKKYQDDYKAEREEEFKNIQRDCSEVENG